MKTAFIFLALVLASVAALASSNIDPVNRFAYGANVGWVDFRGDDTNGAVIGTNLCSGYIYSANVGWINLGSGTPTNGIQYQNNSSNDFGVNVDGSGNLRGYAYGANIGWINFETNGAPKIDPTTGILSGSAYAANAGWISLSNTFAFVQTGGDSDHNGLPDAWEIQYFRHIGVDPNDDPDHDGMSNLQEYLAGTDPTSSGDNLKITSVFATSGTNVTLTWISHATRQYSIQKRLDLNPATPWLDSGLGQFAPDAGTNTTRSVIDTNAPMRFYRVHVSPP